MESSVVSQSPALLREAGIHRKWALARDVPISCIVSIRGGYVSSDRVFPAGQAIADVARQLAVGRASVIKTGE